MRMRFLLVALSLFFDHASVAETLHRKAKDTLTAVEMNHGDVLLFELANGDTRRLELMDTDARILLTNLEIIKEGRHGGGTVYEFSCKVNIDGQPMTMRRYVPVQESFYEPYVIDGVRIWFDGVKKIGEMFNENHGACVPGKDARFALQDAESPVAPQTLTPWYPNTDNRIDVRESYNGDDVWMGTYFGSDLHGGLDVNMPIGTPLWAPMDIDDHFYFNSIAMGHNNNRWRALRRWPNGDLWTLQVHHLLELAVPEHTPLKQGQYFAAAAGELTGSHAHSHFVFKIGEAGEEILLDPWIVFWQIFENNKEKSRAVRAQMKPLSPARAGERVSFSGEGSRPGPYGGELTFFWTFGDGGASRDPNPTHVYSGPGVYPATLTVGDGAEFDSHTQHIVVNGEPAGGVSYILRSNGDPSFFARRPEDMDVYGKPPQGFPHTLHFTARPRSRPVPDAKRIEIVRLGDGDLAPPSIEIRYLESSGWLTVEPAADGPAPVLAVEVNAEGMKPKHGIYRAEVDVTCAGSLNPVQTFNVQLTVPRHPPENRIVVDTGGPHCYVSPYFWLSPRFHAPWCEGHGGSYLMNGGRAEKGMIARYQPDLAAGVYDISFSDRTPFRPAVTVDPDIGFNVTVKHGDGTDTVWMEPLKDRTIGSFRFEEGRDGYVEIAAEGSRGLIVADAVVFARREP